jgi:hypothetical protein
MHCCQIWPSVARPGTRLSGGEQQMLAIARILRTGSRVLLLDEISEGLAPVIVDRLFDLITELKLRGYTILLVEQNKYFAEPLADRFLVVERGKVAMALTGAELSENRSGRSCPGCLRIAMFDIPLQVLLGQITIGLVNGCFYAVLSLGLALIFGLLNVINFAHGALYMLGAFGVYLALQKLGVNYWWSLLLVPIAVGAFGALIERLLLRRLAGLDHLYGLLFTFGLALVLEGIFRDVYGSAGLPYPTPASLRGLIDLGFMRLPIYRVWIVEISLFVCIAIWF